VKGNEAFIQGLMQGNEPPSYFTLLIWVQTFDALESDALPYTYTHSLALGNV
jgi:hypothetical protein